MTGLVEVCVIGLLVLGEGLFWWSTMLQRHRKRIALREKENEWKGFGKERNKQIDLAVYKLSFQFHHAKNLITLRKSFPIFS